jgi:hypothetical protein
LSFPDLQAISTASILVGLIVTAAFIVLISDWRCALFALLAQYVLAAAWLAAWVPFPIAVVRALSGALAMLILYLTLRQKAEEYRRACQEAEDDAARAVIERLYRQQVFMVGFPFRLFALALVAVAIIGIASSMTFLGLAPDILFSGVWLIAAGVLVAILSRDVLRLGLGILMFTGGVCLLETATEESLLLYGLLNIADLLLALVIAHLGALPSLETDQRRRRGEAR